MSNKNLHITHDTNYPPAASAGGENAYYLRGCDSVQRSPSYASCLHKMKEVKAGRGDYATVDCEVAFRNRSCQAMAMQEEEALAGQALYYYPRRPPQALVISHPEHWGERITNLTPPELVPVENKPTRFDRYGKTTAIAKPKAKPLPAVEEDGYAAAINAAMAETGSAEEQEPVLEPEPSISIEVSKPARPARVEGESPMQYARRIAQLNQAA